jgi:hypothetical protein
LYVVPHATATDVHLELAYVVNLANDFNINIDASAGDIGLTNGEYPNSSPTTVSLELVYVVELSNNFDITIDASTGDVISVQEPVEENGIEEGDQACIEWTMTWRDPETGAARLDRGTEWFRFRDGLIAEVRAYLLILAGAAALVAGSLMLADDVGSLGEGLRTGAFQTVSIMTSTGYTTADFDAWNDFARIGLGLLMFIGGCAGSTAGGMKVIRVILLAKTALQEVRHELRPAAVNVLRLPGRVFPEAVRHAVLGFFLLYMLLFGIGTLFMAATGLDPVSAASSVAATINVDGATCTLSDAITAANTDERLLRMSV